MSNVEVNTECKMQNANKEQGTRNKEFLTLNERQKLIYIRLPNWKLEIKNWKFKEAFGVKSAQTEN
jgi:hypothetical protein